MENIVSDINRVFKDRFDPFIPVSETFNLSEVGKMMDNEVYTILRLFITVPLQRQMSRDQL